MRRAQWLLICSLALLLFGCGASKSKQNLLKSQAEISFYADSFEGKRTASGSTFRQKEKTAAHRTLAFGTKLKVVNTKNGKTVVVTITDRGPAKKSRELDLSKSAFLEIAESTSIGILKADIYILN